jgi:hypothetical protein
MGPVVYREDEQVTLIQGVIDLWKIVLEGNASDFADQASLSERLAQLLGALGSEASFLKHPDFAEEFEWRFTYLLPPADLRNRIEASAILPVEHRPTHLGLTPYVEVPLVADDGSHPIKEIWVGPSPLKEVVQESILDYLRSQELDSQIEVRLSPTPYRESA